MTFEEKISAANSFTNEVKLFPYISSFPQIDPSVFLASGAKIIGDVKIEQFSSIWYNVVVRGDVNYITIGQKTNVQDCSMLHVTNKRHPLVIGNKVTIGHSVSLHGCTLNDLCLIGIGAVILDGAVIQERAMVAAGALIKPGFTVPTGKLIAGIPGKIVRDLSEEEMNEFEKSAERYCGYVELTVNSLTKTE